MRLSIHTSLRFPAAAAAALTSLSEFQILVRRLKEPSALVEHKILMVIAACDITLSLSNQ